MIQQVLVYVLLISALAFLAYKFFIRKKKKKAGKDCDNCN